MARIQLAKDPAKVAETAVEPTVATAEAENTVKADVQAKAALKDYEDESVLGSKSDKIEFVAALGDPSRDDVTPADPKRGIAKRTDPTIVGYAFKVLEDMEVPECGAGDDLKGNPMSYVNKDGVKAVKAGETIYLTRFETGMLLSRPEFNARATGGQMPVQVSYTLGSKNKSGLPTASAAVKIPGVALRPITTGQSIKDITMIPVLTFTEEVDANGRKRKKRTIVPGFEKWAALCKESTVVSRTHTAAASKSKRNGGAAAFLQIVSKKA